MNLGPHIRPNRNCPIRWTMAPVVWKKARKMTCVHDPQRCFWKSGDHSSLLVIPPRGLCPRKDPTSRLATIEKACSASPQRCPLSGGTYVLEEAKVLACGRDPGQDDPRMNTSSPSSPASALPPMVGRDGPRPRGPSYQRARRNPAPPVCRAGLAGSVAPSCASILRDRNFLSHLDQ
jgi:hypothetical protein